MKPSTWLLAASLVSWGWFVSWPVAGIALAAAFLAAPLFRRGELTPRMFARAADVCMVASVLTLAYVVTTSSFPGALHEWLRLAPLWLFPLPFAQRLDGGKVPIAALLLSKRVRPDGVDARRLDTTVAYAMACLLAASAVAAPNAWLYPAAGVFLLLLLWRLPRSGRNMVPRALMLLFAVGLGYAIHGGLYRLQGDVEEWSTEWISSWLQGEPDPFRSQTHIGDLGRMKQGNRIVLRARPQGDSSALLLRQAVYDTYIGGQWHAREGAFTPLPGQADGFELAAGKGGVTNRQRVVLALSLPRGHGLLPLPAGTETLRGLSAEQAGIHPLGAVRVEVGARWQSFAADFDAANDRSAMPNRRDLQVPDGVRSTLAGVVAGLHLAELPPARRVAELERYFAQNFRYSLYLGRDQGRSLSDFLLRDRRGHCEYFATATVLLLRQAGVPARYAVGYSAQEYSPSEHGFVVRARHAHAWAMAFVDGRWREIDTTPAQWADFERDAAAEWYRPLLDSLTWGYWAIRESHAPAGILAGVALLAFLAWLWRRMGKALRWNKPHRAAPDPVMLAWRRVESSLPEHPRQPNETPQAWLSRINVPESPVLRQLLAEYYRLRFDPAAQADSRRDFLARCEAFVRSSRRP